MAVTIKKSKIGVQDIFMDRAGTNSLESVPKSDGGTRQVSKLNASHIPVTSTLRDKNYADGTSAKTAGDLDVDSILIQVLDDLEGLGQPDGTLIEVNGGVLRLGANQLTAAKIAADTITATEIAANAITTSELATDAVETANIKDSTGSSDGVTTAKIADDAITVDKIADNAVTVAKLLDTPTHYIVGAVRHSCVGGTTTETATVAAVAATDLITATFNVNNNTKYIADAERSGATTVLLTASAAFDSADEVTVVVYRAVT
jgi:hypothetical protein